MIKKTSNIVIVLLVFAIISQLHELLSLIPGIRQGYRELRNILPYPFLGELRNLIQISLVILTIILLHRFSFKNVLKDIGLVKPIIPAILFGIFATLPMWIAFSVTASLATHVSWNSVFFLTLISPLSEEVVYRGFAFGQIRRHANWGFWPASIIIAVVFGLGHLGINQDLGQSVGVFLITGVGGILFAWIYEKWDYNLWAPFWLHCLMNLNWQVFEVGNSAFAGWLPTTLQVLVAITAIVLTVFKKRIPLLSSGRSTKR